MKNKCFKIWPTFYMATNGSLAEALCNAVLFSLKKVSSFSWEG